MYTIPELFFSMIINIIDSIHYSIYVNIHIVYLCLAGAKKQDVANQT